MPTSVIQNTKSDVDIYFQGIRKFNKSKHKEIVD